MNFAVMREKSGDETVLKLRGDLNILGAPILENEVNENLDETMLLTLDFTECDYVSSAGIRVILGALKDMGAKNGRLRLINVGPQFTAILQNVGLDEVIDRE